MARLLLSTPDGQQVVELGVHNTLGRHPTNSVQLLDKIVSKEHCVIERRGGQLILRDLGSLNGTYVNGERVVGERPLRHGDDIALGSTRARVDDAPMSSPISPVAPHSHPQPIVGTAPIASVGRPSQAMPQTPAQQHPPTVQSPGIPQPPPRIGGFAPVAAPFAPPMPVTATAPRPNLGSTRIDVTDAGRAIGTQITATQKGFLPYDQLQTNTQQLSQDYERLRLSHELSREICMERELPSLLNKILIAMFKFVRADRGCIFLKDKDDLIPGASLRRDGTDAPITVSSTIMNHVIKERATVLTHDAAMDFAGSKGKSMILNRISSAIVAPLLHNDDILGVLWLDSETLAQFQQKDLEMVTAIAAQAAMFIEINILGRKIEQEIVARERFSRLLSPNVAAKVLSGEMIVQRGGQLVEECTVFNSDIRGFTRMSESADPAALVAILNDYFEQMVETIFKYDGTLDKFMGDGIMALWGAPVQVPDDPVRCVYCAIEQMEGLERMNREQLVHGREPLAIGIGIHTGPLVAGYIGSSKALSYTVIGDTANTSARLCGVASAGQIIVSEPTLSRLGNRFEYTELPAAHLKGKEKPFKMFQIHRLRTMAQVPASLASTST
ncbi:MAG TPA: adenylate/guanylate cyclase domain-containing protein [Polyangiaceae bacterium]|jgi:adenylate cyclase|nr:adenylate/guanylate cyclase domain-containing protein [Polyangiaceae bacterium]